MRVQSRTWLAVVVHPDNIVVQVGRNGRVMLEASVAADMLPAGLVDIVESVVDLVDIVVSAVEPSEVVDRLVAAVEVQVQSLGFVEGHNSLEDILMWEGNIDTPV
jgi:hypothetical protein